MDKADYQKGLYSVDGFVTLDDNASMIINEDGFLTPNVENRFDKYVFMYRKDFGNCLRDYFKLTGNPPLLPRYALGVWWNRNIVYNSFSIKELVDEFNKHQIPFSVLLLGENWHIRNVANYNNLITGYSFNRELFPKPKEFIDYLHSKDIYLGLKINPSQGIMLHEEHYKDMANTLGITDFKTIPFTSLLFTNNGFVTEIIPSAEFATGAEKLSSVGIFGIVL